VGRKGRGLKAIKRAEEGKNNQRASAQVHPEKKGQRALPGMRKAVHKNSKVTSCSESMEKEFNGEGIG